MATIHCSVTQQFPAPGPPCMPYHSTSKRSHPLRASYRELLPFAPLGTTTNTLQVLFHGRQSPSYHHILYIANIGGNLHTLTEEKKPKKHLPLKRDAIVIYFMSDHGQTIL